MNLTQLSLDSFPNTHTHFAKQSNTSEAPGHERDLCGVRLSSLSSQGRSSGSDGGEAATADKVPPLPGRRVAPALLFLLIQAGWGPAPQGTQDSGWQGLHRLVAVPLRACGLPATRAVEDRLNCPPLPPGDAAATSS